MTPKMALNITKKLYIYIYICMYVCMYIYIEILMICLRFQFLTASYASSTRYVKHKQKAYSVVVVHIPQNIFILWFHLPRRNHEELLYYLALFLFCNLTGMDIFWYSTVKMLLCSHEVAALSLQATHFLSTWLNRFGE